MYVFKEVIQDKQLQELFHLRYMDYSNSTLKNFIHQNSSELEIDCYDLFAHHYGVYEDGQPAGFIRVVNSVGEIVNDSVLALAMKHGIFDEKMLDCVDDLPEYPFLSYEKYPHETELFYRKTKQQNEQIVEACRFHITSKHRGIRVAKFLVESMIAIYSSVLNNAQHAVTITSEHHTGFYERYGFKIINESDHLYQIKEEKKQGCLLHLNLFSNDIPERFRSDFSTMASEFQSTNQIRRKS